MSTPDDLTPEQQAEFIEAVLAGTDEEPEEVFMEYLDALGPEERKIALHNLRSGDSAQRWRAFDNKDRG